MSTLQKLMLSLGLLLLFSCSGAVSLQADYRITEAQMNQWENNLKASEAELTLLKATATKQSTQIEKQNQQIKTLNSQLATSQEAMQKSEAATLKSNQELEESKAEIATLKNSLTKSNSRKSHQIKVGMTVMGSDAYPAIGYQAGRVDGMVNFNRDGVKGGTVLYTVLEW